MAIALVNEMFNEFNDPDLSYKDSRDGYTEWFKLSFLVDDGYHKFEDGKRKFIPKYDEELQEVMSNFLNKYQKEFESSFINEKEFEVLDRTKEIVKDLKQTLEKEFLIEDKISLFGIDLVGSWQAFKSSGSSKLEQRFYSDITNHVEKKHQK
ncbi:hypothetical protein AKUA1202_14710 [Apilactobacillus kunkeei]|uniref:Uncharacterized protein n=2 Tax=Apilactobacillus kunkeei TaxID=148814 RepID=A0AAC9EZR9_9LACO|nr:hypothetical protein [Apilactobacillus kunkeei]MBI0091534.1 hypothetical protein [Lactobacillus sp. M0345]ALJ31308.1 hypothetical protein APS55_03265 [Apilactobacillus kunkeei]KFJ15309.1 hypothetical protein JI66_03105 [Apilactobacillus kunkeei]KOY68127.1 hypothetical protein RZ73_13090 [Apilactobacillus kunkeei]KOY71735.1 hypothetical protein RZ79_03120 [Apilactobacillus kunkeei DSM 12361 = ATCC 700308]